MNSSTVFYYSNDIGRITFSFASRFWITELVGVSSVDVELSHTQNAGQVGATVANQSIQRREFTIDGCIFEPLAANRKQLIKVMAPGVSSRLTVINGNESYYLEVVPVKTPEISVGQGQQEFQVQLLAAYPYWRTTGSNTTTIANIEALFEFPLNTGGRWYVSRYTGQYFNTVSNEGNVPVGFTLVFSARGELRNPELFNVATQTWIRVNKTMAAGEQIAISTIFGQKGVTITAPEGTIVNGFRYLTVDSDLSMVLQPGGNLLRIDAAENPENLNVAIQAPRGVVSGV